MRLAGCKPRVSFDRPCIQVLKLVNTGEIVIGAGARDGFVPSSS